MMRSSLLACVVVLAGCSNAAVGSGDFSCPSDHGPVGSMIDAPQVDRCVIDATGTLTVGTSYVPTGPTDTRGDFVEIAIDGFSGAGSYTTSQGGTIVSLRGSHLERDEWISTDVGSEAIGTCGHQTCTIVVTGATPTAEAPSAMSFEISCSTLNTQTPDCAVCEVHTAPIVLDIPTCEAG